MARCSSRSRCCGQSLGRRGGRVLPIAPLQHAYEAPAAANVSYLHDLSGRPGEVLRQQVDAHARGCLPWELAGVANISCGGIETAGQQNESGVEGTQRRNQPQLDGLAITLSPDKLVRPRMFRVVVLRRLTIRSPQRSYRHVDNIMNLRHK